MTIIDILQKTLDNQPKLTDLETPQYWKLNIQDPDDVSDFLYELSDWFKDFTKKFAAYRAEFEDLKRTWNNRPIFWELRPNDWDEGSMADCWLEEMNRIFGEAFCSKKVLPVGEWLTKHAKTFPEMIEENSQCCKGFIRDCCDCKENCGKEQWVSVPEIQRIFFAKEHSIRKLWEERPILASTKYAGIMAETSMTETLKLYFKTDVEWRGKLAHLLFDETYGQEIDKSFVLIDHKQLSDIYLENITEVRNWYESIMERFNDDDMDEETKSKLLAEKFVRLEYLPKELKELLEGKVELSEHKKEQTKP